MAKLRPDFFARLDRILHNIYSRDILMRTNVQNYRSILQASRAHAVMKKYFYITLGGYVARHPENAGQKIPHQYAD